MDFSIFAYVAVLLLVALLSTRLMAVLKLPNVTGYIVTGIIMGPFLFGVLFYSFVPVSSVKGIIARSFLDGELNHKIKIIINL